MLEFILKNLGVVFLVIFLWLAGLTFFLWRFFDKFANLTRGVKSDNLVKILEKILQNKKQNAIKLERLDQNLQTLEKRTIGHLQKVSLLRFNPFGEVGGDQSFVATFLDGENSGIIISSLHSRAGTRVYAKPVEKGEPKSGVRLSDEETKGLKVAVSLKNA